MFHEKYLAKKREKDAGKNAAKNAYSKIISTHFVGLTFQSSWLQRNRINVRPPSPKRPAFTRPSAVMVT